MKEIPNGLLWYFDSNSLKKKKYLKDLDFIKQNTRCNYLMLRGEPGVNFSNAEQCHPILQELVAHAHEIGLKIMLHIPSQEGFLNVPFSATKDMTPEQEQAQLFLAVDKENSEAITCDYETVLDKNGYAEFTHVAKWSRPKIAPTFSRILKIYAFEKTGEGFYKKDSLVDVTDTARIVACKTNSLDVEVYAGKQNAGKTIFAIVAQFYNAIGSGKPQWDYVKSVLDKYADIPLDGVGLDEWGMSCLNTADVKSGKLPPFRGRRYSKGMNEHFEKELGIDLSKLLFDMRYAPELQEQIRIKAINVYFEQLRLFPLYSEIQMEKYAKKLFGEDIYVGVHNTFHNNLSEDEMWHTCCNWWDLPREYGHTDESICFPVRMGVMMSAKKPIMIDTDFSLDKHYVFNHVIEGARYNCREFHHAYDDFYWGQSFTEPIFLKEICHLDDKIKLLNSFQTEYPKMDVLLIYGTSAQNNWYPNYDARNKWDLDGSLNILEKSQEIWDKGYRCALIPDYTITDGRTILKDDGVYFNGHKFSHVLFLYPKYAKKQVYKFLNDAHTKGVPVAAIGKGEVDFDGEKAKLLPPQFEEFSISALEKINCTKSAIDGGSVYTDGSFCLVSDGILTNNFTEFDFTIDKVRYSGKHSGLLAYRKDKFAFATLNSVLYIDGKQVDLEYK